MAYEKEIDRYVEEHKEEMLKDLADLVRINSEKMPEQPDMPYGEGPWKALQAATSLLEGYGFKVKNHGNRVITLDFSEKERKLDILAHLDVVPPGEDWTVTTPFEPVIRDGKIYGRGTSDDKGPAVAAIYALRTIKELGIPLKHSVRLILGSDEECGSTDLDYYFSKEKSAPMSFTPDASWPLINIEKGGVKNEFTAVFEKAQTLPYVVSVKGGIKINVVPGKADAVLKGMTAEEVRPYAEKLTEKIGVNFLLEEDGEFLKIKALGVNCHASTPEMGKNAIQAIIELLAGLPLSDAPINQHVRGLQSVFPYGDYVGKAMGVNLEDEISGKTTVSFNMLTITETSFCGAYDCRASIIANDENTEEVMEKKIREAGFTIPNEKMFAPHVVDGNSELVQTLLKSYEKGFGVSGAKPIAIGGGTYVHHIENGVAFGCEVPEVDNHMHGPDEFMVVDMLIKSAKIFADAIVELCGLENE